MAAGRQGEPLASSAMSMKGLLVLLVMVGGLVGGLPATASVALTTDVAVGQASARPLTLVYGGQKFVASAGQVAQWYKVNGEQLQLRPGAIYDFLNTKVSPRVNDLGEQSRFAYVGSNLHLLQGGRKGKIVDGVKTSLAIRSALVSGKSSVAVHMKQYRPSVFSAEDFKKLSFPHKLAVGESNFAGSPANRVHNIHVATKRYDGLVLLPGEEFSFNQYLGEVDASNGYLPELVIKEGVTTPEYGGGVCQVSTTAFRGALEAGLKITERHNHSYPVEYYGTPGYDATIYSPSPDLKFKNDTGAPVYIRTYIRGTRLQFEMWGTNDGRTTEVIGPFVTAKRPNGSLTAAVAQIVRKGGKSLREQNFVSNYQSADKFPAVRAANGG